MNKITLFISSLSIALSAPAMAENIVCQGPPVPPHRCGANSPMHLELLEIGRSVIALEHVDEVVSNFGCWALTPEPETISDSIAVRGSVEDNEVVYVLYGAGHSPSMPSHAPIHFSAYGELRFEKKPQAPNEKFEARYLSLVTQQNVPLNCQRTANRRFRP